MRGFRRQLWRWIEALPPSLAYPLNEARARRFHPQLHAALAGAVVPGRRAIDVGAHRGGTAWLFARRASRVEAFEPNPANLELLRRLDGRRIRVHGVALSDGTGRASFSVDQADDGELHQSGSLVAKFHGGRTFEVEVRRLDDYGFADVGFVKIDVEGAEMQVLRGARETLARCRPSLVVELNGWELGEAELRDRLTEMAGLVAGGYRISGIGPRGLIPLSELDFARDVMEAWEARNTRLLCNNFLCVPA